MTDPYSLPTADESVPGFIQNLRANALLKEATRLKNNRDMGGAIKTLEAAEIAISEGQTTYSVDTYTKRPLYMQQAGRGAEAVERLLEVLELYPSGWGKPLQQDNVGMFVTHVEKQRGAVYDKLRLVLQRDGRFSEAIPYGVLAETYVPRIDFMTYSHLAERWKGKGKPQQRELSDVMESGGTSQGWMEQGKREFEWQELERLKPHFENGPEGPKLNSVAALLKKLKRSEHLSETQAYAHKLIGDFNKSDAQVIIEIQQIF